MAQYIVAFEASASRPVISSSPAVSNSISGSLEPGFAPRLSARSPSVAANPVSVLPGAYMAGLVERQAAQRARRAAGRDQLKRALGERARGCGSDRYPQDRWAVLGEFLGQRLDRPGRHLLSPGYYALGVPLPSPGRGPRPEVLPSRPGERPLVRQGGPGH